MNKRHILIGVASAIVYAVLQLTVLPMLSGAYNYGFHDGALAVAMRTAIATISGLLMYAAPFVAGFMAPRNPIRVGIVVAVLGQLVVAFASYVPNLQYQVDAAEKFLVLGQYLQQLPLSSFLCITTSCAGAYFSLQRTSNNSLQARPPRRAEP